MSDEPTGQEMTFGKQAELTPAEQAEVNVAAQKFHLPEDPTSAIRTLLDEVELIKIAHPQKRAYLGALAVTGTVSAAARAANISRSNVMFWRKRDPVFAEVEKQAQEHSAELLMEEAIRRASVGTLEPVFGPLGLNAGSGVVGHKRKYSDSLMMFLLGGMMPEKFKGRQAVELSGPGGGPIQTQSLVATIVAKLDQIASRRKDVGVEVRPEPEAAEEGQLVDPPADGPAAGASGPEE